MATNRGPWATTRLGRAALAIGGLMVVIVIVGGVFALSNRVADEAIERSPLAAGTSTPSSEARPASTTSPADTPTADIVSSTMPHPDRQAATGVVLADGRVLLVGGSRNRQYGPVIVAGDQPVGPTPNSAVIYDPTTNQWSGTAAPPLPRSAGAMVLAGNGQPMLWGGSVGIVSGGLMLEAYDWLGPSWSGISLPDSRTPVTAIFETSGRVLAVTSDGSVTRFEANANSWVEVGTLDAGGGFLIGGIALADSRAVIFVDHSPVRTVRPFFSSTIPSNQLEYLVLDLRTGEGGAVRSLEGPPYRPLVGALPDGGLLLWSGLADDPTEYDRTINGQALVRDSGGRYPVMMELLLN